MSERRRAVAAATALVALGLAATVAPRRAPPPPVPCAQAEAWMVDALPGVGRGTRAQALAAVRSGRLELLPPAARARAAVWFAPPQASGTDAASATQQRSTWRYTASKPSSPP
jgi:hypothetical protein